MIGRAALCGAAVGLAEAARALVGVSYTARGEALWVVIWAAVGYALAAAALSILPQLLARRSAAWLGGTQEARARWRWAIATGCAVAALIATWRLRRLVGLADATLLPFVVGPLLEGVVAGGLAAVAVARSPSRRTRAGWLTVAALAAIVATTLAVGPSRGGAESMVRERSMPNVLLVTVDTLRPDRLGAYGRSPSLTPHLDRLAAESALFETAIAPVALTGPSHTSILTGLFPQHHGAQRNGELLRADVRTLPEMLARSGYRTAGFVSAWPLTATSSGLAARFELYDENLRQRRAWPLLVERVPLLWLADRSAYFLAFRADNSDRAGPFRGPLLERDGAVTVRRALRWIERQSEQPFFAFVHLYEPHQPYAPPREFLDAIDPAYDGELHSFRRRADAGALQQLLAEPGAVARVEALYDAEVAHADALVGRLLAGLERLGRADDTLVVFTADHGESLTEHGELFDHADFLYDTTLRVPLLVRTPDRRFARQRVDAPVRLVDVAPTVLALVGARPAGAVDGVSLVPWLEGQPADSPPIAFGSVLFGPNRRLDRHYLRTPLWKLMWTFDERGRGGAPALEELYELATDSAELRNLLVGAPPPEGIDALRELLREWVAGARAAGSELPAETRRQLESLGYL